MSIAAASAMTRRLSRALLVALLLVAGGCGYFTSGTWDDDPDNWRRAFHSTRPDDVVVVHSRYWQSPHWSLEFAYAFEIAANAALEKQLLAENGLRLMSGAEAAAAKGNVVGDPPAWFAPKSVDAYHVWASPNEPGRDFTLLIDKETGTLFLSDHQL